VRQVSASEKTTNLGRKALEANEAVLGDAPDTDPQGFAGSVGQVLFICTSWSRFSERPCVRRSFLFAHFTSPQVNSDDQLDAAALYALRSIFNQRVSVADRRSHGLLAAEKLKTTSQAD
jgi:hypothetical protein